MTTTPMPPGLVSDAELEALHAGVRDALPAYLGDLERLVNIDCGSYTPDGVDEVGRFVAAHLGGLGARVDVRPDAAGRLGATVVATLEGAPDAGPSVLLIGHMDTVFEPGTVAERPFRIDEGIACGPGVSDMKAGLLGGLYALAALRNELGALPFSRLTFIANPDEEIGSPTSTPHIREAAADADVCLVLECARANGDIVSSRKGIADLRIDVRGRAAHAGVEPEKGRSAILAGAHLVRAVHELNGRWDGVTANVGVFKAGTRPNIVPDAAHLEIDLRAVRRADLEAVMDAVRELTERPAVPDVTMSISTLANWWPMEKLAASGRLVDLAGALARRLGFDVRDAATGGASDANTTSGMGVPTLDGLGPIGGRDHSPDEYLEVDSIVPRTALVAALLLAIARDSSFRGGASGGR